MANSQWGVPVTHEKRKAPYTEKQKATKEMNEGQRKFVEHWNLFVDILQENGLMEDKKGG
ncbi:hypothetical protein [Paenibacillus harenae]|uniref:hypothetical protein n=1 Tax=Paenibacillus harenae TaxID=306543 RepID=UPI00278D401D|nr:hypothetical protein [Paenibacillus harenae]MDQ0062383.1 hypothetical protein [Paenibacillus harenae]